MLFVGIDWAYRRAAWCAKAGSGEIVAESVIPADEDGLARLVLGLGTEVTACLDRWGWENLAPWLELRARLPVGALFCVLRGPTRGRPCARLGSAASYGVLRSRPAFADGSLRSAQARPCRRDVPRGRATPTDPAPARPCGPRDHLRVAPPHGRPPT
jgi:hypothetical protein